MAWPPSNRAVGYIVTNTDWNDVAGALALWGGNVDAGAYNLTNVTQVSVKGATSGSTAIAASATASGTLTLPAATDTLVGKATTDTFTNKTFDTAGTGNVFRVNGTAISAVTGSGSVVLTTSPTLYTPTVTVSGGSPWQLLNLTNATGGAFLNMKNDTTFGAGWDFGPTGGSASCVWRYNTNEYMRVTVDAVLKIGGTANRATTEGSYHLDIFNGTAPSGTLSNGISIYSSSGEAYVMDATGNATLFSPHDRITNEWIFDSTDTRTGKRLKIDVERLLRFINEHFGLDCVHELTKEV